MAEPTTAAPAPPKTSITSAPGPIGPPLTEEARQQRFAEIRRRMGTSVLTVEPPPGYTGYFARKEDTGELTRLRYMGFEIVREVDLKKPLWKANGLQPDGTYVIGDVILMGIESDLYEFHLAENRKKSTSMIEGGVEGFKNDAAREGVPTFNVSESSKKGVTVTHGRK